MSKGKLATQYDTPQASPGLLLWQVTNKWQARQRAALKAFDLTHVQFVLLASLTWAATQPGFTQKELAAHAHTDAMMTSQVVRRLAQKGLVTRTANAADGRSLILRPTPAGIRLANKAVKAVEAVDTKFFAELGADNAGFIAMMQRLVKPGK